MTFTIQKFTSSSQLLLRPVFSARHTATYSAILVHTFPHISRLPVPPGPLHPATRLQQRVPPRAHVRGPFAEHILSSCPAAAPARARGLHVSRAPLGTPPHQPPL